MKHTGKVREICQSEKVRTTQVLTCNVHVLNRLNAECITSGTLTCYVWMLNRLIAERITYRYTYMLCVGVEQDERRVYDQQVYLHVIMGSQ